MKRKKPYLLAGLVLLLFLLCTACGNTEGQIAPQDDPNEGLGGGLSEDTVNDFSGFEGIWLGEADNDYDSMEFDAEGNWTLYLSGEVVDDGYLRYEPEWEAIYAYLRLLWKRWKWKMRTMRKNSHSIWNWKKSSILPWKKQWPGLRPCLSQKRSHIKKTM